MKMYTSAITALNKDASITCVADGEAALGLIIRKNYDIIIVDAEIPGPGLIVLLKEIISKIPKIFILVTARPSSANGELLLDALSIGAVECMTKPIYDSYEENLDKIRHKIDDIINILRHRASVGDCKGEVSGPPIETKKTPGNNNFHPEIVLIAASTGGPKALEAILSKVERNFPVPILVVQHITSPFTGILTQRLDNISELKIKVAEYGETITEGTVYFAPGGMHMRLDAENKIYFDDSPPLNGVRPAADALFESIAEDFTGTKVLALILTGMGSDGKDGLTKLKNKKECYCISQSERTCAAYGMPGAVAENGLADKVLDLEEIPSGIKSFNFLTAGESITDSSAED